MSSNSAVLGYPQEVRAPLDADHHGMSKFKSVDDQNYIQVRNALCTLLEEATRKPGPLKDSVPVASHQAANKTETPAPTRRQLSQVLGVHSHPKTDLDIFQDRIMAGSCRWILDRDTFQQWRDGIANSGCALLWLKGLPGVGKSILSSFVISTLQKDHPGVPCCYYFFNSRDQTKRSVKNLLTSIALQLGLQSRSFGKQLLKWGEDGNGPVDQLQAVNLWASIFQDLVFGLDEDTPMFWVIDGLDEADDPKTLVQLFKKLEASHRLRIWIASRHIKEMTAVRDFGAKVSLDEITLDDTSHDIRSYANRAVGSILPDGALDVKDDICKTILSKAQGSFLWVSLAIDQLENRWHTPDAIREALEDLPEGMEGFYDRMMATIAGQPATRALACRILTWAMCSFRPLSLAEVEVALAHEFPRLVDLEGTITQACASFVVVRNEHIALLHDTARAFLLDRDGAPPLSIDLLQGEAHAAEMCLRYLIRRGDDLRRILSSADPADRSGAGGVPQVFDKHPFLAYAVTWWAYHFGRAPQGQDLAALAQGFLRRFTLVWIHAVSLLGDMRVLTRAAESLLTFLENPDHVGDEFGAAESPETQLCLMPTERSERGAGLPMMTLFRTPVIDSTNRKLMNPPHGEPTTVEAWGALQGSTAAELFTWATDLRRVVWRFGSELIQRPLSIYHHTITFCPTGSMIRRSFSTAGDFTVVGDVEDVWPEHVARHSIPQNKDRRSFVFCSGPYFVVSAGEGSLIVYYAESSQEVRRISHGEEIVAVASRATSTCVATASATEIRVWDLVTGEMMSCFSPMLEHCIMAVEFGAEELTLLIGYNDRSIHCVTLETLEKEWGHFLEAPEAVLPTTTPYSMFISPELRKVAVGYMPEPEFFVWCLDSPASEPQQIRLKPLNRDFGPLHLKNPTPDEAFWHRGPPATLVLNRNLELYEHNLETGTTRSFSNPTFGWAAGLAGSSDGKFIASQNGARSNIVLLTGAPTYSLVATVTATSTELVRALAFSVDNQRLYIISRRFCNVWEPAVLMRAHGSQQLRGWRQASRITDVGVGGLLFKFLFASPDGRFYGVRRDALALHLHETENGKMVRLFLRHDQPVSNLRDEATWSPSGRYAASAEPYYNRLVVVEDMENPTRSNDAGQRTVFELPRDGQKLQLLFHPSDRALLVFVAGHSRRRATPVLLDPRLGIVLATGDEQDTSVCIGRWQSHPTDDALLLYVDTQRVRVFKWDSVAEVGSLNFAPCNLGLGGEAEWGGLAEFLDFANEPRGEMRGPATWVSRTDLVAGGRFLVLGVHVFHKHAMTTSQILIADLQTAFSTGLARLSGITKWANVLLGCFQTWIVYLDQDSYLCTFDPSKGLSSLRQHFYLPKDWLEVGGRGSSAVTKSGMILCLTVHGAAVIQNWFKSQG